MPQYVILALAGTSAGSRSYVSAVPPVSGAEYANDRQNAIKFAVIDVAIDGVDAAVSAARAIDAAVSAARAAVAGESRLHEVLLVTRADGREAVSLIPEPIPE
jgi:hypothetical protein